MDPLVKVKEAHQKGIIPDELYSLVKETFPITIAGINRIEKASGIAFPVAYVEPPIVLSAPQPSSYQYGILFARTIPIIFDMDKTILYNLEKIRSELVPNCKHPQKMRDRTPDGQWYCMSCNLDL